MTRMTPAKYVAEQKNALDGGAATPNATEGVRPITTSQETVMTHDTPTEIQIIGDGRGGR